MSANDVFEQIRTDALNEINTVGNDAFEALVNSADYPVLPESIFKEYFLPRFLGEVTDDEWVLNWISVAGTPMVPVNVIDDRTKEVLFTVPPYLSTTNLISMRNDVTYRGIFDEFERISSNIPPQGVLYLVEAMTTMSSYLTEDLDKSNDVLAWKSILDRYGYKINTPTQTATSSQDDDIFAY